MIKSSKNLEQYLLLIFILFPILLISGPLLTDLTVILFSIFFLIRYKYFNFNAKSRNFIILVCLFYLIINISSLLSDNILLSLKSSLVYFRFIFFSFVVAILIPYVERNQNISKYFNFVFQFIFIFFFIDSFYQFFNNENLLGMKITSNLKGERVSSIFGSELILGSFISKVMFIYLGFLHGQKINNNNNINIDYKILFIFIISLSTIFISGDRSALVLAIIGTLGYLIINLNFRAIFIIFLFMVLVFFTAIQKPLLKVRYIQLFNSIFLDHKIGQITHHQHFKTSYKMFKDKKLIGHGIKSFRYKCNLDEYNSGPLSCSTHPHNYYLQILSSTGIFTFLIISIFFIFILVELFKIFVKRILEKKINNKKTCYLISMFISIFPFATTGSFFNNWISASIFLSLGFLLSEYKTISYQYNKISSQNTNF